MHISGCQYNETLRAKTDESTFLSYSGMCGELEHLKMETRLIVESFESVMGQYVIRVVG